MCKTRIQQRTISYISKTKQISPTIRYLPHNSALHSCQKNKDMEEDILDLQTRRIRDILSFLAFLSEHMAATQKKNEEELHDYSSQNLPRCN